MTFICNLISDNQRKSDIVLCVMSVFNQNTFWVLLMDWFAPKKSVWNLSWLRALILKLYIVEIFPLKMYFTRRIYKIKLHPNKKTDPYSDTEDINTCGYRFSNKHVNDVLNVPKMSERLTLYCIELLLIRHVPSPKYLSGAMKVHDISVIIMNHGT